MRKRRIVAFVMCAVMQMCPVITMADDVAQTQETMSAEGTSAKSVKQDWFHRHFRHRRILLPMLRL